MTFGLTAGLFPGDWPTPAARRADAKLLGVLGLVAFADLFVGFVASIAGIGPLALITALIAGAVGGPLFWLWLGLYLWREA